MTSRLSSLSVSTRLGLIVVLAVCAIVLVAVLGARGLKKANDIAAVVVDTHLPAVGHLSDLRAGVGNLRRFEKDMFLYTGDIAAIEKYWPRWQEALAKTKANLEALKPLTGEASAPVAQRVQESLDAYGRGFEGVVQRLMRGEFADSTISNAAMEPLKGGIRSLDEQLLELKTHIDAAAEAERQLLAGLQQRQLIEQGSVVGVTTMVLVTLAWALVRSITRPLAAASSALERLSQGDLSHTIDVRGQDELAHMMRRLDQTQQSLRDLIHSIQGNARSVATASEEIAQGNADLSARTERQAASLQQTAASMEQLTATVTSGADRAQQANTLAKAASDSARQGGEVVADVVKTMQGIQESSRRIADITSVIDGIAFQTNILALNAAVEAARAGEQGRGFAVVASEVRALAQRSAEAAREIKSLIGTSVERVEAGHQLVQKAGGTIEQVVTQVRRVTDLMGDMHAAASEQQQGIAQVGQAVTQLDQTTQQNAALVEESAAAADSLRQQAERLSQATAVFRLGTG